MGRANWHQSQPRCDRGAPRHCSQVFARWWGWPPHAAWTQWKVLPWVPYSSVPSGQPGSTRICGTGLQCNTCHNACVCWAGRAHPWTCPAPSPCKGCTASVGLSGKAPRCSCCNVQADREARSCPYTPRAGTARHSSIDHEPALGPLPWCFHCAVRSKRPYKVAGDCAGTTDRPHIHRERRISLPGRRTHSRSGDTWHIWTRRLAGNCRRPRRPTFVCRGPSSWVLTISSLCWNAPRLPQQLEDHYEANSWLSREPLSWPRPLSGIPAAMNHGEQSTIEVPWHCWMRANLSPVATKYNSSYTRRKTAIRPLILFVLMWNFLFRCQIFCKNNHNFFNFSTGNVCELTIATTAGGPHELGRELGTPLSKPGPEIVVPGPQESHFPEAASLGAIPA